MDKIEKGINDFFKKETTTVNKQMFLNFERFKKEKKILYELFLKSFEYLEKNKIENNKYQLICDVEIQHLKLKENLKFFFVFCGVFNSKFGEVLILKSTNTFKMFYFEDVKLIKQLKKLQIGTILGIEKTKIGIDLLFPHNEFKNDLFSETY